ncbi:hypothetical protein RyT2_07700 [Pseudolactococcus yaeyamensis]
MQNDCTYLDEVEQNYAQLFSNFCYQCSVHMMNERALIQLRKRTLHQIWNYRDCDFNTGFYVPYRIKKRYADMVKDYVI